jgi:hypothetical protein
MAAAGSWADIRREVAQDLNGYYCGTIGASSTSTITDAALQDSIESDSQYVGGWVVTGDSLFPTVRRISAYIPATGTISVSRAWSVAPTTSGTFEIHWVIAPERLHYLINQALRRCFYVASMTPTIAASDQSEFSLSGDDEDSELVDPRQIVGVYLKTGDTANQYRMQPLDWYELEDEGPNPKIRIRLSLALTDVLVVRYIRCYDPLSDDPAQPTTHEETDCPMQYVKAATMVECFNWLAANGPAEDSARFEKRALMAAAHFSQMTRVYAPRPVVHIQHPDTPYRSSNVG